MRLPVTARLALAVPVAVLALAGSAAAATAPGSAFESAIKTDLTNATKVQVTKVSCPATVNLRKGQRFTCRVRFASGDRGPAKVVLKNATGSYRVTLRDLLMRHLEDQLESDLGGRGAGSPKVTCPRRRAIRKGDVFTCKAFNGGNRVGAYRVVQTGSGLVKATFRAS